MTFQKNESLGARKEKLVHEAGHVSWMKDIACSKQIVVYGYKKVLLVDFDLVEVSTWLWSK